MPRRFPPLVQLGALALALAACTGPSEPSPSTPTPLTDAEAFAAAEATYRAYVDALNQVDLADPTTFEPVYALTTGEANAAARESLSQMYADGWSVDGESVVIAIAAPSTAPTNDTTEVQLTICVDVADVTLEDPVGDSMVDPLRPDRQAMNFHAVRTTDGWSIQRFTAASSTEVCE